MVSNSILQHRLHCFEHEVTLYPVSCERLAGGRSDDQWLAAVLAGGARIVQLRDKEADDRTLYDKALRFRARTREVGALLIVNNRIDIALLTEADGVHLGDTDLPAEAARRLAPELLIGVSCHTREEVRTARNRGASYYNIGPLFETGTKQGLSCFLGSRAVTELSACSDLPFTVMGGIKLHHVPELTRLGARRIAVVTALTQAPDMAAETRKWIETIDKGRRHVG
jgi:thiamine-phosphate pyrophosphorylase